MKLGLYRTNDSLLGECARVHWLAGDGAPYLARSMYEATGLEPQFDELPSRADFLGHHPWYLNDRTTELECT